MTGNVLERGAAGTLILILPIAFALVVLYSAWPYLLLLLVLSIAWKIWERYQWKRWSQQVNPFFNQLIKENQGCLTATDLALKANLTGGAARRFLEKKAEEYGAQRKEYKERGTVYYFITASALGSIFADSDPLDEEELLSSSETEELPQSVEATSQTTQENETQETTAPQELPESVEVTSKTVQEDTIEVENDSDEEETPSTPYPENALIQSELAKRLDVHSSTVGKRKSDPDFAEWSQSRDPEGMAWQYSTEDKVFIPIASSNE